MKLLIVDHNAVDPLARTLYQMLCREGDIHIRVIVPAVWFDNYRIVHPEPVNEADRFEVVPLPVLFHGRTHRMLYRGIADHIRDFRPDVFYVNAEPENFQTLEAALLVRRGGDAAFVFSTWRNIEYSTHGFPYHFSAIHGFAERFVLRRADAAIAFVPEAEAIFSGLGFDRVTWIPPEVDTSVFSPLVPPGNTIKDTFTIGYAGRLHILKGVDLLLSALSGLPDEFRLMVVGTGPEEAALRGLSTSLGLESRVSWREPVPRAHLPNLLREMDVLALPSRTGRHWKEQFGRILIEAMACGIPVVGSDSGGIPGVISDAGIVVPEGEVQGFREAFVKLHDDTPMRHLNIRRGLLRVSQEYAAPAIASRYRQFIGSLVR